MSDQYGLPMPRRLLAIVSISAGSMLYTLDGGIPAVALPLISDTLRISEPAAVLIVTVYNLVLAMTLLPLAAVGERWGHKRVFIAGTVLYLVASALCIFVADFTALLVLRGLQALAAAALLSVSLAMVRMVYPSHLLGRGLGFNTMVSTLGAACAAPLGAFILSLAPWNMVFAAGIPLAILAFTFCRELPDSDLHSQVYDKKGAILCAATFGLVIGGIQALSQGSRLYFALPILAVGVLLAIWFVRHERRVAYPVLPVDLLGQRAMALSVAAALCAVLASTLLLLDLPFRLHDMGFDSTGIGLALAPYALTILIAAPLSGALSDRVSPNILGTVGMAIATVGIVTIFLLPQTPSTTDLIWRVALCGLGFSLFFSPNGRLVVGSVPRNRAAGASSLLSTTRMFGQSLGATGLAGLLALRLPATAPSLIAAGLASVALLLSVVRLVIASSE
jgi:MFS transporter, DHA2 family, multidrug resistance protein